MEAAQGKRTVGIQAHTLFSARNMDELAGEARQENIRYRLPGRSENFRL